MPTPPPTAHAARAADAVISSFFAQLAICGVTDVVVSPGSRSTPLAIAARRSGLTCHVGLDERSAGFFALGLARGSDRPVVLVCTSGTAAANYHPAVVEAHHSAVPLIVCTADRPPELRGWGAGQTIDQLHLFGTSVRWFAELPVASEVGPEVGSRFAIRALAAATSLPRGPVHLNWPLRKPLEPPPTAEVAPATTVPSPVLAADGVDPTAVELLARLATHRRRGVIVAGPVDLDAHDRDAIVAFAARVGWPILADPLSSLRWGTDADVVIGLADHVVAAPGVQHAPQVVVRLGAAPTSMPVQRWMQAHPAERLVVVTHLPEVADPSWATTDIVAAHPGALLAAANETLEPGVEADGPWVNAWARADRAAAEAIASAVRPSAQLLGPEVARTVVEATPAGAALFTSNSMAVRVVDAWVPGGITGPVARGHRGANGIDGIVSGAAGISASTGAPVVLLIGDLAVLHDLGGLLAAVRAGLPLVIVVLDNDGGGIFSLLPIAEHGEDAHFTELFHTPHGHDIVALAAAAGAHTVDVGDATTLAREIAAACERLRPTVLRVGLDHCADIEHQRALRAVVADAVSLALPDAP